MLLCCHEEATSHATAAVKKRQHQSWKLTLTIAAFVVSCSSMCVSRRVGGSESDVVVSPAYAHARIPRMELVVSAGRPTNWKSVWPPTK